jgi:hypothetical protein
VENFSVRKINALFSTSIKNDALQNRALAVAVRMGMSASANDFEKWMKAV